MKDLINKFIANAHLFILAYALWGLWVQYDEHSVQVEELTTEISKFDSEIAMTTKKIREIQDFVKKAAEYRDRVEGVAKNIEEVQKQLPADINDTQIITFLSSEINTLNIKDASISPGKEEPSVYFISKDYSIKGKGTFLQFLIFLERIGNATRIYNVKTLRLVVSDEQKKGRFQMVSAEGVIQAFRYNPDFKVDRGFDKIESLK